MTQTVPTANKYWSAPCQSYLCVLLVSVNREEPDIEHVNTVHQTCLQMSTDYPTDCNINFFLTLLWLSTGPFACTDAQKRQCVLVQQTQEKFPKHTRGFTYILYGSVTQGARGQLKGLYHNMGHSLWITAHYPPTHYTHTHTHWTCGGHYKLRWAEGLKKRRKRYSKNCIKQHVKHFLTSIVHAEMRRTGSLRQSSKSTANWTLITSSGWAWIISSLIRFMKAFVTCFGESPTSCLPCVRATTSNKMAIKENKSFGQITTTGK